MNSFYFYSVYQISTVIIMVSNDINMFTHSIYPTAKKREYFHSNTNTTAAQKPFSVSGSSVLHAGDSNYFPKYYHYQFGHTKYVFLLLSKNIIGVMSRSGIYESKGKCICSFVRQYQIFCEGQFILHLQAVHERSSFPQLCHLHLVWNLKHFYNFLGEICYLNVVLFFVFIIMCEIMLRPLHELSVIFFTNFFILFLMILKIYYIY